MTQWKPGETLHMDEGVYITANPPAKSPQGIGGGGPGQGGAGFGNTPWGPYEGPHRGTGGGTIPKRQEATIHEIMGGEQTELIKHLDGEYRPRRVDIPAQVDQIVATAKVAHSVATLPVRDGVLKEYEVVSALALQKQDEYLTRLPLVHQFFNNNPIYQLSHQYLSRMLEKNGLSSPEALRASFQEWENSYRAAQELNLVSESNRFLIKKLPEIAQRQYEVDQAEPGDYDSQINALQHRLSTVELEHRLIFQILPGFLQAEVVNKTASTPDSPLTEALDADGNALAQLAAQYHAVAQPSSAKPNPSITPPLAKLELAGLKNLVEWQSTKVVGARWAEYHASVFNAECARYLLECAAAVSELQIRAQRDAELLQNVLTVKSFQEAARVTAEQQAQEAARVAAEQQAEGARREALPRGVYSYATSTAALPAFALAGGRQLVFPAASSTVLQASIRAGVVALAAGTAGTVALLGSPVVLAGLVVGVVALTLSSKIGNGEMQVAISTPLADLVPVENLDLRAVGAIGGGIELPYTLVSDIYGGQPRLMVVKPDGVVIASEAKVYLATPEAEANSYSVSVDSPARNFTFTPVAAPGTEQPAHTASPSEPVETPKYDGIELQPIIVDGEGIPALDVADTLPIVIGFPAESGLPPLLVVFSKTPVRLGETGLYDDMVPRSAKDQLDLDHIPAGAAIAETLRRKLRTISEKEIQAIVKASPVIAIPSEVHRKYSETYGGRNTKAKIDLDAMDLNIAIDNSFDAILPGLLEYGMSGEQAEQARQELKALAKERGLVE